MNMRFSSSIFNLTTTSAAADFQRRHEPLLPPLQNSFHPHNHSSSADISFHKIQPLSPTFADYLSIPSGDDVAELEWLSQFVDDCSNDDFPTVDETILQSSDTSFNSKADYSQRSRAAGGEPRVKTEPNGGSSSSSEGEGSGVRRCTHCATEKTPQWRSGPLGRRTLCNACGVRYKSGRLLPEYRPASSPTFELSQHSNSHRKVLELRRQKEMELMKLKFARN